MKIIPFYETERSCLQYFQGGLRIGTTVGVECGILCSDGMKLGEFNIL